MRTILLLLLLFQFELFGAQQGDPQVQHFLAVMYDSGYSVIKMEKVS